MRRLIPLVVFVPGVAFAQGTPKALVLEDAQAWGASVTMELAAQGVAFDVVRAANFAASDLNQYTMLFVTSCQADAVYNAWNNRQADIDAWVSNGGFAAIHGCVNSCGAATLNVFPQPPGGNVAWISTFPGSGNNVAPPGHPIMLNVPASPTGTSLAHVALPNTGNVADVPLITSAGNTLLFHRPWGLGNLIVGTLTYEFGYVNNQDAGIVLRNEVTWGQQVGSNCDPYGVDTDGDTISDDCDQCPGFNDLDDLDADRVPDGCDICPGGDDRANRDGDAFPDACDNCADDANDSQADADADTVGDACDACPGFDDLMDADADTVPDACDICVGGDDRMNRDGDLHPDSCDNCPNDANDSQADADFDGAGDVCDMCPGIDDAIDADADTWPDPCDNCPNDPNPTQADPDGDLVGSACDMCPNDALDDSDFDGSCDSEDICPGFDDGLDTDGDRRPDGCDNCPFDDNGNQRDEDADGAGDVCDCAPSDPTISPIEPEICDGIDNNCSGYVDDVTEYGTQYWPDADGDGFGDANSAPEAACEPPSGMVDDGTDCDDTNAAIFVGAEEVCDGIDNNCDGVLDDPTCADSGEGGGGGGGGGCGCDAGSAPVGASGLLVLLALAGVRRRAA